MRGSRNGLTAILKKKGLAIAYGVGTQGEGFTFLTLPSVRAWLARFCCDQSFTSTSASTEAAEAAEASPAEAEVEVKDWSQQKRANQARTDGSA